MRRGGAPVLSGVEGASPLLVNMDESELETGRSRPVSDGTENWRANYPTGEGPILTSPHLAWLAVVACAGGSIVETRLFMTIDDDELRERSEAQQLIRRCLQQEEAAVREFQEIYGPDVYHHPLYLYRLDKEAAADFYIFAFDEGRIFRRLQTYSARAPFRAYLTVVVLDNLVYEWRRARRSAEVLAFGEVLADDLDEQPAEAIDTDDGADVRAAIGQLPNHKALLVKLLHIEDHEFTAQDYTELSKVSGRPLADLKTGLESLQAAVRQREQRVREGEMALATVQRWIECYEQQVRMLQARSGDRAGGHRQTTTEKLADLEERLRQRRQQREKLLARLHLRKRTTPYREIARLLNASIGTVSAQVTRLRQDLRRRLTANSDSQ